LHNKISISQTLHKEDRQMSNIRILHYAIKYQDSNIAVIKFSKKELSDILKNSVIYMEMGECPKYFWQCFSEALLEISGVSYIIPEGYDITVVKDCRFPNWGRIIEDLIWCSLFFLNPDGGAIEVSKNGMRIGKLITQKFDEVEPEYRRKRQ